jgi:hypothetical protein
MHLYKPLPWRVEKAYCDLSLLGGRSLQQFAPIFSKFERTFSRLRAI